MFLMLLFDCPELKQGYGLLSIHNLTRDVSKNFKKEELFIRTNNCFFVANIELTANLIIPINEDKSMQSKLYLFERSFMSKSIEDFWEDNNDWLQRYDYSLYIKQNKLSFLYKGENIQGLIENEWTSFYKACGFKKEYFAYEIPSNAKKVCDFELGETKLNVIIYDSFL